MAKNKAEVEEQGTIKQGSVAEFFRKRTQLVGFDFGLHKHTQYAVEFLDNSLDAIESFQWKIGKKHPDYSYSLKDDLILENLSYFKPVFEEDIRKIQAKLEDERVDDEGYELSEDGTIELDTETSEDEQIILEDETLELEEKKTVEDDEEARHLRKLQKKEEELEEEVQKIMNNLDGFIYPIKALVDREPFVIIQLTEKAAQQVYAEISKKTKEVYEYRLDIFDNGTGMSPIDLEKFGKYLASSKSQKLKQTRGSQGFGSPSAFSDAQNTTGKPVTVVSKDINHIYGICSQFYTTSKNNKEYMVPPTEVTTPFEHGSYISLNYLNVKYRRGFIDEYIKMTSLTNPHVTIIYLDPYGNEEVYPRRVDRFPREPTYALPHPTSVNIGDFQDKLRVTDNLTISSFLQDNFVRISSNLAKKIIHETEQKLEGLLRILNVDHGFISWLEEKDTIYYGRTEKRVWGRSKRKRDKLIVYEITNEEDIDAYWKALKEFNTIFGKLNSLFKKSRKIKDKIHRQSTKTARRKVRRELRDNEKVIEKVKKELENAREGLIKISKNFHLSEDNEVSNLKLRDKFEDKITELLISEANPTTLTQRQTEELYKRFKAQKYMAPPSDPAVPIGASVLETTMLKEYNLNPSHRTDLFLDYEDNLNKMTEREANILPKRILAKFNKEPYLDNEFSSSKLYLDTSDLTEDIYKEFFQKFDVLHTQDEDFVHGYTRKPTSGKGLAFVVEAVIAISPKIDYANTANQVLNRYVNRTPKMRDNSDCAIWKGVQSVNWKNYKLDTFDNGIPKGHIRILVNISGPYVHLMFKSQSKNALAEDEILLKEIKMCLEAIGRKIRRYKNKKIRRENRRKRSKVIEKYIPIFVGSLMEVAQDFDDFKDLKSDDLENMILARLNERKEKFEDLQSSIKKKIDIPIPKPEPKKDSQKNKAKKPSKTQELKKEDKKKPEPKKTQSKEKHREESIKQETSKTKPQSKPTTSSKSETVSKPDIKIKNIKSTSSGKNKLKVKENLTKQKKLSFSETKKKVETKTSKTTRSKPKPPAKLKEEDKSVVKKPQSSTKQKKLKKPKTTIKLISTKNIIDEMKQNKWYNIKDLIKLLKITDIKDARYLQLKLKQLTREKKLLVTLKSGKTYYKLNPKKVD